MDIEIFEKNFQAILCFGGGKLILSCYSDTYMVGDPHSSRSTSGVVIFAGGVISWQSKLQKCVALFIIEIELIAVTKACTKVL